MRRSVSTRAEDLVRRAARLDDPEDGLRAVSALRASLNALEEDHVRNALVAGRSWGQIARAIGISRQAAHKRFADRCRPEERPPAAAAIGASAQARRAVRIAVEEAASMGHASAGPEHLLLALLRDDVGPAVHALEELGVHYSAARREVRALYGESDDLAGAEPAVRRVPVSARARQALERAVREAVAAGADEVGVEHVLLGVLGDAPGGAVRALAALGITPRRVQTRLRRILSGSLALTAALR
jgi:hypothetical protein